MQSAPSRLAVVLGPCARAPRFTWNTAIHGDLHGAREQAWLGSYHAAPGSFPEAYAAKCAASWNQDPVVEIYTADRWRFGPLRRVIRVPEHWLVSITEEAAWAMVRAEALLIAIVEA